MSPSKESAGAPQEFVYNRGAENTPYFTPIQDPPAGTAWEPQPEGSLFSPLKLRGLTLQNRIIVSPMCQYSAQNGYLTPWHKQHLGSFAARGPGLVITEVAAVSPEGRISPEDVGIWEDGQMQTFKEIVDFAHSQNSKICMQIGHAGRKASTLAPFLTRSAMASKEANGWPDNVIGPDTTPFSETFPTPKAMTLAQIDKFKEDFKAAVKRALAIGFDAIEIHAAHGYLLSEFLSPASNSRTDQYGGSFENRIRLLLETLALTREIVGEDYPILIRYNGSDYLEHEPQEPQWTVDDAARLGKILADAGADLLDISGGGNNMRQQPVAAGSKIQPGYQVKFASAVKKAVAGTKTVVSTVGLINTGTQAQGILSDGHADAVMVARGFLRNPNLVWSWAEELNIDIHVAAQYGWGYGLKRDKQRSIRSAL